MSEILNGIPDYVSLNSFKEEEIVFGEKGWELPGTLSYPKQGDNFPAVVLVHGSGAHDRDETISYYDDESGELIGKESKPFRDIAHGLVSKGIAVFRYDKRTKVHGKKMDKTNITVKEEIIDDALYAVDMLCDYDKVNPDRVYVLGHSKGGYIIPRIGTLDSKIFGFIIMAGSTRFIDEACIQQQIYIYSQKREITGEEREYLEQMEKQIAKSKDPNLSLDTPVNELPFNIPPKYWLDLREYNLLEAAQGLSHPMLVLHAERDYQVTMEDFNNWKKALSSKDNAEFRLYQGLNHLFKKGDFKEYFEFGFVDGRVIDDIAGWIKKWENK